MSQSAAGRERRKTRNIDPDVARHRGRLAALNRGVRGPNDPQVAEERRAMIRAQQTAGGRAICDATGASLSGDPDLMTEILRSAGVPVAVMLLESVELLAYLLKHSDRPTEVLATLRARVDAASTD